MLPKEKYNYLTAQKVIEGLEKRNMDGFYCETKQQALEKALELIEKGSTVSYGGSESIKQLGLLDAIRNGGYNLLDRDNAKDLDEKANIERDAFRCDWYLMSTNAITLDGKLVNIDGSGNRIAAMIFGPKNVIIIAGINKVAQNEEAGIVRAKNAASPANNIRLSRPNPCAESGFCHNCLNDTCICSHIVITRRSGTKGRIKVILVGEELGY